MAVPSNGSRCAGRLRDKGRFARDPTKPPEGEPHPTAHAAAYRKLRKMALRLTGHLEQMLPPAVDKTGARVRTTGNGPPEPAAPEAKKPEAEGKAEAKTPDPAYERLLGRNGGVIDGFNTLTLLVIRLSEKERESRGQAKTTGIELPAIDERELDRRILAELDFIARQRGIARSD